MLNENDIVSHDLSLRARTVNVTWISTIRRYLLFVVTTNLIWEFAQLPLYTIWKTGTVNEMAFAVFHCTGGDLLIALSALLAALCMFGDAGWPEVRYRKVMIATILIGVSYTVFSEWLNIEIRRTWAYSDLMPVIPVINTGLSPVLQWIIIPFVGLCWATKSE